MGVKNPASALGEAVGKLAEDAVRRTLANLARERSLVIGRGKLKDKVGVEFSIDLPIFKRATPIALVDVKYLRYAKHARDKASWVVVAHSRLRASKPSIRANLVILLGPAWTKGAKKMMSTGCLEVWEVERDLLNRVLDKHGVGFVWGEKNEIAPRKAWENFQRISEGERIKIADEIVEESGIRRMLEAWLDNLTGDAAEKLKLDFFCKGKEVRLER